MDLALLGRINSFSFFNIGSIIQMSQLGYFIIFCKKSNCACTFFRGYFSMVSPLCVFYVQFVVKFILLFFLTSESRSTEKRAK